MKIWIIVNFIIIIYKTCIRIKTIYCIFKINYYNYKNLDSYFTYHYYCYGIFLFAVALLLFYNHFEHLKNLMIQCWDADPLKRPDIITLLEKIREFNLFYQSKSNESTQLEENNNLEMNSLEDYTSSSKLFTSKLHQFENLPEPRNATEGIITNIFLLTILDVFNTLIYNQYYK